jgi:hypothetical protein
MLSGGKKVIVTWLEAIIGIIIWLVYNIVIIWLDDKSRIDQND